MFIQQNITVNKYKITFKKVFQYFDVFEKEKKYVTCLKFIAHFERACHVSARAGTEFLGLVTEVVGPFFMV